jgi:hypothetical protein
VELTTGEVVSISVGDTQVRGLEDILYLERPTSANTVNVGLLLNNGSGFANSAQNQYTFQNVTDVVATIADIDGDTVPDFVFATSPRAAGGAHLCIFFGTKAGSSSGAYAKSQSGCTAFNLPGNKLPVFASIAAAAPAPGARPQIYLTDSANNVLYIVSNAGKRGDGTSLSGFSLTASYPLSAGGAGPIVTGDFNKDNKTDLIVDGQAGNTASVYLGDGDGTFAPPAKYGQDVHSMLVQDIDGDGIPDLIAEGDQGVIRIYKGHADGTFDTSSEGGTTAADATGGEGGHLAAINPKTLDILTTGPAGLSVLKKQPGTIDYTLQGIYNIGSGRTAFALADFFNQGTSDLAVGSAEGVAILSPDADGGFQTARAYPSVAPATSVAVAKFRADSSLNDVAVAIGPAQSEILLNNSDGTFVPSIPASLGKSNPAAANTRVRIQAGDFSGQGEAGLLYSGAGSSTSSGSMAVQPRVSTAAADVPPVPIVGVRAGGTVSGNSVVADFNGDGVDDIAVTDATDTQTLLGQRDGAPFRVGFSIPSGNSAAGQIAAGFFKSGRTSKQDLVIQQGSSLIPYANSGDGEHFSAMQPLAGISSSTSLVLVAIKIADLDGDGNGDVVALYSSPSLNAGGDPTAAPNQLYIWFGKGDGTFGEPEMISLSRHFNLAAIGDMNADGHPDIVLADNSVLSILYNQGGRTFYSDFGTACSPCGEQHFLAGQGINDIAIADVNGDGSPDIIVANGGQTITNARSGATPRLGGGVTVLPNASAPVAVTGTVVAQPEPSAVGASFTVIITITPPAGSTVPPTGTIQLSINGQNVGGTITILPFANRTDNSAGATVNVTPTNIGPGSYPMVVTYSGDANYAANTFNGSHVVSSNTTQTNLLLCVAPTPSCPASGPVVPLPPYVPVLSIVYGQAINGAATVSKSDSNSLTGTTSFVDNGVVVCSYLTIGGQCPSNPLVNLQTGQHNMVATYSGDPNHAGSTSPTVTINVAADNTTTTLTGGPNPATQGTAVTFTATVTGQYAAPVGSVTFLNGSTPIGTATLVGTGATTSTATLTTNTLPVGTDQIVANFGGSLNFLASGSGSFAETITPIGNPSFQLTVGPQALKVGVGYTGSLNVTITSINGFSAPVNLSCGPLPRESTCTFLNPVINGAGATTLFVATTAPHDCNSSQPYFLGSNNGFGIRSLALPALAGLFALCLPGRRKWLRGVLVVLLAAGAMSVSGCGNCTDLATRPGTYSFTVNATTAGSSGQTQSQTVTMNVFI